MSHVAELEKKIHNCITDKNTYISKSLISLTWEDAKVKKWMKVGSYRWNSETVRGKQIIKRWPSVLVSSDCQKEIQQSGLPKQQTFVFLKCGG